MIVVTGDPVDGAESRFGTFPDMIQRTLGDAWSGRYAIVDLRTSGELPDPTEVAGAIVTGSPARLSERTDWMLRGLSYLRALDAALTPTLGICFGHQMLGEALGGRVGANPNGREIGTVAITSHRDNPLLEPDQPFTANASHLDSVVELPPGAQVFAETRLERHATVRFSESSWGVQFHPEMDGAIVAEYLVDRRETIESEGIDVDALLAELGDAHSGRRVLPNFVRRLVLGE
jgi:GMP synthase (glutamine-hydrolysing)